MPCSIRSAASLSKLLEALILAGADASIKDSMQKTALAILPCIDWSQFGCTICWTRLYALQHVMTGLFTTSYTGGPRPAHFSDDVALCGIVRVVEGL